MQDEVCVVKQDDLIVAVAAKSRAKRIKKVTRKKKKMSCIFKRRAPKSKNRSGFVDVINVTAKQEEARETWELGKQIGLIADNEDEVIATLLKDKEVVDDGPEQRRRKRSRKGRNAPS